MAFKFNNQSFNGVSNRSTEKGTGRSTEEGTTPPLVPLQRLVHQSQTVHVGKGDEAQQEFADQQQFNCNDMTNGSPSVSIYTVQRPNHGVSNSNCTHILPPKETNELSESQRSSVRSLIFGNICYAPEIWPEKPTASNESNGNNFEVKKSRTSSLSSSKQSSSRLGVTTDPDDTYAKVCSLGSPVTYASVLLNGNTTSNSQKDQKKIKKSKKTEESSKQKFQKVNEGWSPMFYKSPLLPLAPSIPIPYPTSDELQDMIMLNNEKAAQENASYQSHGSSNSEPEPTDSDYYGTQSIPFWVPKKQAMQWQYDFKQYQKQMAYYQSESLFSTIEELNEWRQKKLQNQQQQQREQQKQQQQQQAAQQMQQETIKSTRNTNTNDLSYNSSKDFVNSIGCSQKSQNSNFAFPQSRNNFGSFGGPIPTPTATAFSSPFLWSVDASNPFWLTDQRPSFAIGSSDILSPNLLGIGGHTLRADDPNIFDLLYSKPKKQESQELVNAIKAGVGIGRPTPLEIYYLNLQAKNHENNDIYIQQQQQNNNINNNNNQTKLFENDFTLTSNNKNNQNFNINNKTFLNNGNVDNMINRSSKTRVPPVQCDYVMENWNDLQNIYNYDEENKQGEENRSEVSTSSLGSRFTTPSELKCAYFINMYADNNKDTKSVKAFNANKEKTCVAYHLADNIFANSGYISPTMHSGANFDMAAVRLKLQKFDLYVEAKSPRVLERQSEYTVDAMKELLKSRVNNRSQIRGLLAIHQTMKQKQARSKSSGGNFLNRIGTPNSLPESFRYLNIRSDAGDSNTECPYLREQSCGNEDAEVGQSFSNQNIQPNRLPTVAKYADVVKDNYAQDDCNFNALSDIFQINKHNGT